MKSILIALSILMIPCLPSVAKQPTQWAEAPRDTNFFQVEPTILNEHYYRSGMAEKTLQLPGVLPAGATIPDEAAPATKAAVEAPVKVAKQWSEAPRDTNFFQVEPTILNERHYRSGAAEKTLKLPGVLPANAPIPDNV